MAPASERIRYTESKRLQSKLPRCYDHRQASPDRPAKEEAAKEEESMKRWLSAVTVKIVTATLVTLVLTLALT